MMEPMIEVRNFSKRYGSFTAVNNIGFTVPRGQIFGLLGPNGAGKTSVLECLEGLRAPDSGILRVGGVDPTREQRQLRNLIGVQLQSGGMPESITPVEAMALFCAYHDVPPRLDLLDRFNLTEKRDTQFHALSTGQQRRLALALAIAHEPPVLFLDEPTAGLDVASRAELHNIMRELKVKGATIILATHDMAEAEEMADRAAILLQGELVAVGRPLDITAAGAGLTKVSVHTKNGALIDNHQPVPAVKQRVVKGEYVIYFSADIGQTVSALIALVGTQQDTLLDLRVERPSLEDRFLELTNDGGIA